MIFIWGGGQEEELVAAVNREKEVVDGVALLTRRGQPLYCRGLFSDIFRSKQLTSSETDINISTVLDQFVGVFDLIPNAVSSCSDVSTGTTDDLLDQQQQQQRIEMVPCKDVCKSGFCLWGLRFVAYRADQTCICCISSKRKRGLTVHRIGAMADCLLLVTYRPTRPHITQRVISCVEAFCDLLTTTTADKQQQWAHEDLHHHHSIEIGTSLSLSLSLVCVCVCVCVVSTHWNAWCIRKHNGWEMDRGLPTNSMLLWHGGIATLCTHTHTRNTQAMRLSSSFFS